MRHAWLSALIIVFLLGVFRPQPALAAVQVFDPHVEYTFGGQITFRATIQSDVPLQAIRIFFRAAGETYTQDGLTTPDANGNAVYIYDLTRQPLRAFTTIDYWYVITPQSGEAYTSGTYSFTYEDNRFDWQTLQGQPFRIHWYDGDEIFGQAILDTAQAGLDRARERLLLSAPETINIYVYASALELQSSLRLAGANWVAGHAEPDLGVMAVSLPPGPDQLFEAKRQIPHELMHILLFNEYTSGYSRLPKWLNEGLASFTETNPDPNYRLILERTYLKKTLLPMADLCQSFPVDQSGATLAYAQSESFVSYLYGQYGLTKIQALATSYVDGLDCQRGMEVTLGSTLNQVEKKWRQAEFGENLIADALGSLLPWLGLMALVLVVPLGVILLNSLKLVSAKPPSSPNRVSG